MITQIYDITTPEDAAMVASMGAHHIGVVVGETHTVPDEMTAEQTVAIFAAVPKHVVRVGLTITTDIDEIVRLAKAIKADYLHLSARPEEFPASSIRKVHELLPGQKLMLAVPVGGPETRTAAVGWAKEMEPMASVILLDTMRADAKVYGATGIVHDWSISREIVETVKVPVILAGGLGPDNVAEAIRTVRPWGVDSLTKTSFAENRSLKDPVKVKKFVEEAMKTAKELGL